MTPKPLSKTMFLLALCAALGGHTTAWTQKKYDPGASDTEIKVGQTMPYSGPASSYGTIGRSEAAYFEKINDEGGVNGRKIVFLSLDDGYSPPKAVEATRRLVEQDQVLLMFGSLGTATNSAVQGYLNGRKVPQLFVTTDTGAGATATGGAGAATLASSAVASVSVADCANAAVVAGLSGAGSAWLATWLGAVA